MITLEIWFEFLLILIMQSSMHTGPVPSPIVVNTWPIPNATDAAWHVLVPDDNLAKCPGTALDAVVVGCSVAEEDPNITSVGYGCSPDENGHTTLDAMVMDGRTMEAGAVASLVDIHEAIQVARDVLQTTYHTLLVGPSAAEFAKSRGYKVRSLDTQRSHEIWKQWREKNCQPNYRRPSMWSPDPSKSCGPYHAQLADKAPDLSCNPEPRPTDIVDEQHHDTIGMIALDHYGSMAVGLSTSGATHKIPGRVGDSPIPGAGGYVDNEVGGAVGTGDGDIMMRFLLSFHTVQGMRSGLEPTEACIRSLMTVKSAGPWSGAIVAMNNLGQHGAACVGFETFKYCVRTASIGNETKIIEVPCMGF